MTTSEIRLLLFLETQAVDHVGLVFSASMNDADFTIAKRWDEEGYIQFGRRAYKRIAGGRAHCVVLSDSAFNDAARYRKERAQRGLSSVGREMARNR